MSAAETTIKGDLHPSSVRAAQMRAGRPAMRGLRLRAMLLGLPLLVLICVLSVYADMVLKNVQFGVLQLAPPAVAALFFLALFNLGVKKLLRREFLNRADILIIYAMLLVGVMVSTRGVVEKVIPPLAYLPYNAKPENKLNELVTSHMPAWAMPYKPASTYESPPDVLRGYYERLQDGQTIPWSAWIGPLAKWFGLIACVIWIFACLSTLMRRQWMDNEQLRFPLTMLPLAIIRNEINNEPFFTNMVMWMGFCLPAVVFAVNGMNANFPDWPKFILDININYLFTERPFNQMDYTQLWISLAAIGFAYFLPADLLLSLWVFFWLTRVQDVIAVQMGGVPTGIGTHNARIFTAFQAAGAYFVLVLAQIRLGWPYFKQVWRTAFGGAKPLDDSGELMSYRTAIVGLVLGFAGVVFWLSAAGMSPVLATAYMGIYLFFVAVIMSRAVCEAGLLMTETSFLPSHLIRLVCPLQGLGATNLSMMAMMDIMFARDLRGVLLSPMLDDQKMAGELGVRPRSLLFPLALAVVVAFVVASYVFLSLSYNRGHLTLYAYPNGNAGNMFNQARAAIQGHSQVADSTMYGGFALGVAVTTVLVYLRTTLAWFPLNPLAYAIAPTWSMICFWFPFFVAWLIKTLILRFGGVDTYRRVAPFMLGMILGEFGMAVFWCLLNAKWGMMPPGFPWP